MAVPFAEVIMHTYIDLMRHKAEDLENGEKVVFARYIFINCIFILEFYYSYGPELETIPMDKEEFSKYRTWAKTELTLSRLGSHMC